MTVFILYINGLWSVVHNFLLTISESRFLYIIFGSGKTKRLFLRITLYIKAHLNCV